MLGSLDHFFDVADQLTGLGAQFTLLVKHPNGDGVLVLCNVEDPTLAGHMAATLRRSFNDKFINPSQEGEEEYRDSAEDDEDDSDDPNTGTGI